MIDATARARLDRVHLHNTRPALERMEYAESVLVDIWFKPEDKDQCGWRGPANVKTVNSDEGDVTVRYQGRSLDRAPAQVRPHIPYFIYLSLLQPEKYGHLYKERVRHSSQALLSRMAYYGNLMVVDSKE